MKFTRLGIKLFCFFLIVSLVPLGISGIVVYQYIHSKTKDDVLLQLQFNSRIINEKLHLLLSKRIARFIDFGSDGFIRDSVIQISFLTPEQSDIAEGLSNHLIKNKKSLDPDILEIEIINYSGKVIASTSKEEIGKDRSNVRYFIEPYLKQEQNGQYFENTVYTSGYVDKLQLVFSKVLKYEIFHKPLGVIVIKVKGSILQDMLSKTSFINKGEIYILDSNQYLLASSIDNMTLVNKQMNSLEVQEALASREESTGRGNDYNGNPVLCTALYVPETNWVILSEKSIDDAFGRLVWIKYIFSISGGGALLLVFIFAFIGSNNVIKIIKKLIDGTRRITKGDLECPIEISRRNDELKELGESFNSMMNKLNDSNINNIKFISELKAKEDSLRKSEEQLQAIMDNTTAVIYLKDIHGRYILINRQFENIFHITRKDIIGKTDIDIFPKEMAEAFKANDLKVLSARVPLEIEETAPQDDGPHTYISIKFPLFGPDGVPDRICGISTDITDRKKMEERLSKLSRAVKQSSNTIMITDAKGKIEYVNPIFTQLTGYTSEEVIGRTPHILKSGKTSSGVYKRLWDTIMSGVEWRGELCNKKKNGEFYWELVSISPVKDDSGSITHFIAVKDDITIRKLAEERIVSYQKQLKYLASSLSLAEEKERRRIAENLHDRVGQSLIVLKMQLESMQGSIPSNNLNPILNESHDILKKTIQEVRSMTFELSPPILYELGLVPAVEWLIEQFQKQHDIKIKFESDNKIELPSDDLRSIVFKSVRELLFNIVKHAKARNAMVSIRRKNDNIQVHIKDDGIGFNPHDVNISMINNSGFGLFSIRERLEHLGGRMSIKSKQGYGTYIILMIPLKSVKDETRARILYEHKSYSS